MIVYKAVNKLDGHWTSVIARDTGLQLLYRIGHMTCPTFGKLFAFRSLYLAREFRYNFGKTGSVVLRCEAHQSEIDRLFSYQGTWTLERVRQFWDNYDSCAFPRVESPYGTVFCDWVKPIEVL